MKPITDFGNAHDTSIDLDANQAVTLEGRRGTSILCVHGQVWVTQEGDLRDYIMPRGLRFVAPGPGRIVVNGTADRSRIEVSHRAADRRGIRAQQTLQIDMQCVAQIELEARRARSAYFATALDTLAKRTKQAWLRVLRRLASLITVVVRHKPRENT